ncbi:MAG: hypothetical protein HOH33_17600, partial [Verrucomicrobia bacterium]|nr:hypothetical protein [Verrucomicrobiota bacterium]
HEEFPGASIVYDQSSPVFEPHDIREFEVFEEQRNALRHEVFNQERCEPRVDYSI